MHLSMLFAVLYVLACLAQRGSTGSDASYLAIEEQVQAVLRTPILEVDSYQCTDERYGSSMSDDSFHFRGTSLGGWLVLEPWITPSLFYQFLGLSRVYGNNAYKHIAIDSYTFCTALSKEEANRQLRIHWKSWVTEEEISMLANLGIDTVRIPIADWMYMPYEPFIGCWDGALEELDRVLDLCEKYHLKVLLDLHALRFSQVGQKTTRIHHTPCTIHNTSYITHHTSYTVHRTVWTIAETHTSIPGMLTSPTPTGQRGGGNGQGCSTSRSTHGNT
ncbi:hypothetical protein EON63_22310 [archaeon]|nr:MAG: hypothetical protein EON63_22310 [archaeon]